MSVIGWTYFTCYCLQLARDLRLQLTSRRLNIRGIEHLTTSGKVEIELSIKYNPENGQGELGRNFSRNGFRGQNTIKSNQKKLYSAPLGWPKDCQEDGYLPNQGLATYSLQSQGASMVFQHLGASPRQGGEAVVLPGVLMAPALATQPRLEAVCTQSQVDSCCKMLLTTCFLGV